MQKVVYINISKFDICNGEYRNLNVLNQALAAGWKVVSCNPVAQHVSSSGGGCNAEGDVGAFFVLEKEDK